MAVQAGKSEKKQGESPLVARSITTTNAQEWEVMTSQHITENIPSTETVSHM